MRPTALSTILVLAFAFVATPAHGSTITVLGAKFTATVTVGLPAFPHTTKTKTSMGPDPVSASLSQRYCDDNVGPFECEGEPPPGSVFSFSLAADAAAGWLEVSAHGDGGQSALGGDAIAEAVSEWTFSPVRDGFAYIDMLGASGRTDSWQSASLFDLTTNEQVWRFFAFGGWGQDISETVPTFLSADHVYLIHLNAYAAGRGDPNFSTLRVSNLHVPDNVDSFVCLCMGLLVALLGKWKLQT